MYLVLYLSNIYAIAVNALYAAALCAHTIAPLKASREPMLECEIEESLFVNKYATPQLAPALRPD